MISPWYDRGYRVGKRARWTVVLSVIAFFMGAGATFYWHGEVFGFLLAPAGELLSPFDGKPVFNSPTDMFGATLNLSIAGGKLAAFPVRVVGFLSLLRPLVPTPWCVFLSPHRFIALVLFLTWLALFYCGVVRVARLRRWGAAGRVTVERHSKILWDLARGQKGNSTCDCRKRRSLT